MKIAAEAPNKTVVGPYRKALGTNDRTPPAKKAVKVLPAPSSSSRVLPKTYRKIMFPKRCARSAWMKRAVKATQKRPWKKDSPLNSSKPLS